MQIERKKSHKITRLLVEISGIWLWMSFMYLFLNIALFIADHITPIPNSIKLPVLLLIVPIFAIIGYVNAHRNYIRSYDLYLKNRSDKQPEDVCIIHISDLHIGSSRTDTTIKQVVENINKIAQQKQKENIKTLTIISGDISDGSAPVLPDSYDELKKAEMPVIFTPGNHDYYQGIENVKKALENANVIILDDENMIYDDMGLNIIGLSFSFDVNNNEYKIPISDYLNNILIYHVPELWDELSKQKIDVELSGHTHGGQFYPMNFISEKIFKYNRGLFRNHIKDDDKGDYNSYLSVSEGVGTFAAPIRLGTHSEIVVLNINRI